MDMLDVVQEYAAEALVATLSIVFGIWAKVVRTAGQDIATKLERATDKLAERIETQNTHMVEFMRVTEQRLARLEARQEQNIEALSEFRAFLRKHVE